MRWDEIRMTKEKNGEDGREGMGRESDGKFHSIQYSYHPSQLCP
jgi:hypothetical protein